MWAIITKPFAWLMVWLYTRTGSYGLSVILFALAVNLVLTPFMAKSKKSMMRSTRLQPRIAELQRRHEGNPQKLNAEMQKLYREEKVNPMSGCLWSLIPFPILIALYSVIRQPITRMMFAPAALVTTLQDYFVGKGFDVAATGRAGGYVEIQLADLAHQYWDQLQTDLAGKLDGLLNVDFSFLGLNLGNQPDWRTIFPENFSLPAFGLFLIPFISALLSWASMKLNTAMNPSGVQNEQTEATMKSMNMVMPLMSIWICFIMPAAMGVYWISNSVFGMVRDFILTKLFRSQLDKEDAERLAQRDERIRELEEKRLETERLKAEGRTEQNSNTSKKKLQAGEKQRSEERKAALEKAERAARRERLGIKETEKPASQVGNRRFARGRAYVEDRYDNPETAQEASLAAAAASALADALEEDDSLIAAGESELSESSAEIVTEESAAEPPAPEEESAGEEPEIELPSPDEIE